MIKRYTLFLILFLVTMSIAFITFVGKISEVLRSKESFGVISSEEELIKFLTERVSRSKESYEIALVRAQAIEASKATIYPIESLEPERYSKTNVQVLGVDEPDFVKTDGRYIYLVNSYKGRFYKVKAYPVKNLSLEKYIDTRGEELFISKDKVILIWKESHKRDVKTVVNISLKYYLPETCIKVLDKRNLSEISKFCVVGEYKTARYLEDKNKVFIISEYDTRDYPIVPYYLEDDKITYIAKSYYPIDLKNVTGIVIVTKIDLDSNKKEMISILVEGEYPVIYCSKNNLYIATYDSSAFRGLYYLKESPAMIEILKIVFKEKLPNTNLYNKLPRGFIEGVIKILDSNADIKTKIRLLEGVAEKYKDNISYEDQQELTKVIYEAIFEYFKDKLKTNIIKVSLEKFEPIAYGKVPGKLLNQFSLDEYKGYLRLATTSDLGWNAKENNVYVLDEDLNIVGKLEGLEEGEEIYTARFLGDKLFLVTYKQIDPFLVIDLSDPKNPKVLGRLKIPGYSTYLHPISDRLILAIGSEGWYTVKIALYDVSNLSNPKELDKIVIEGSSELSTRWDFDHKAFLYDSDNKLAFIPVKANIWRICRWVEDISSCIMKYGKEDKIVVVKIKDKSLELIKELKHPDVSRSLYIDNYLITVSHWILKAWDMKRWKLIKELNLPYPSKTSSVQETQWVPLREVSTPK